MTQTPLWLPYVFSYGMGAESTAALVRILTCPDSRPPEIAPDFHNLIVIVAQTGDEWNITGELVEEYVLPLLRKHQVRFVEVARNGPREAAGITVLQDSRVPFRVHLDGVYKLSDEHRDSGTMPQTSGYHTCAQKSKGVPLDAWRRRELGMSPYIHMIGYNVLEQSRMAKDMGYRMGGLRQVRYLVAEWRMNRQDCVEYLLGTFGIVWPKSCCRQCPYISRVGWVEQFPRFVQRPAEGVRHLVDEYCCLALNPRSGLYGPGKSLATRLERDGAREVIEMADARMAAMPWAVYRVRRRFLAPAKAPRSVRRVLTGTGQQMRGALTQMSIVLDIPTSFGEQIPGASKRTGDSDTFERLWVHRRVERRYPSAEEFYVAAPLQPVTKEAKNFDKKWKALCLDLDLDEEYGPRFETAAETVRDLIPRQRRTPGPLANLTTTAS